MSRGRESPRFWWGQTSVNTDTFFSEAAHPHSEAEVDADGFSLSRRELGPDTGSRARSGS